MKAEWSKAMQHMIYNAPYDSILRARAARGAATEY